MLPSEPAPASVSAKGPAAVPESTRRTAQGKPRRRAFVLPQRGEMLIRIQNNACDESESSSSASHPLPHPGGPHQSSSPVGRPPRSIDGLGGWGVSLDSSAPQQPPSAPSAPFRADPRDVAVGATGEPVVGQSLVLSEPLVNTLPPAAGDRGLAAAAAGMQRGPREATEKKRTALGPYRMVAHGSGDLMAEGVNAHGARASAPAVVHAEDGVRKSGEDMTLLKEAGGAAAEMPAWASMGTWDLPSEPRGAGEAAVNLNLNAALPPGAMPGMPPGS
eukprot:RCo008404